MSASIGRPYLKPNDSTVTLVVGDRLAAERPLDALPQRRHRQRRGVDDQVGGGPHRGQHRALGGNALGQRLLALQRMAAAVLLVAAHQDVVGRLHEQHARSDVAGGQFVAHRVQVAGESPRPHVHHHRQLGDPRAGGQAEIDHPGDQLRRQVVGHIPAEILEHLGGGAAPGPGQPGHQNDVDTGSGSAPTSPAIGVLSHFVCTVCHPDACSAIVIIAHRSIRCSRSRRIRHSTGESVATPSASSTAVAVATPIPGTAVISSTRRLLEPRHRSEMRHQRLAPVLAETGHRVQRRGRHPLGPLAAVDR